MNSNSESEAARTLAQNFSEKKPATSRTNGRINKRLQRVSPQQEVAEDRMDAVTSIHRLKTNEPSQNRSLDELRKALGR